MTLITDTSSRRFPGNRHTYGRILQLRADLESLARGCLIWPDASLLIRQRCAPLRAPNTGAVSCALTAAGLHQPNHLDRLPKLGYTTPPALRPRRRRSTSTMNFATGPRRGEFDHLATPANRIRGHTPTSKCLPRAFQVPKGTKTANGA